MNRILAHGKGYAIISMLEYLMGKELFEKLIVELLARYAQKSMSIANFITVSQEMYGRDLSWFFDQWLNTCKFIDYAIDRVHTESGKIRVNIRRSGEAIMPVIVRVTAADGRTINSKWDGIDAQVELEFEDVKWTKIEVDPDHWLPDMDMSNNVLMK